MLYWLFVVINMITLIFLIMLMVLGTSVEPRWPLLADIIRFFIPGFPANLVDLAVKFPLQLIVLILVISVMYWLNKQVKFEADELSFQVWQRICCGKNDLLPKLSFIVRNVAWIALLLLLFFVALILLISLYTYSVKGNNDSPQPVLAFESTDMFCENVRGPCRLGVGETVSVTIASNRKHNETGIFVEGGKTYIARFISSKNWCDGNYPAKPNGVKFQGYVRFFAWWVKWLRPYPKGEWFEVVGRIDQGHDVFPVFNAPDKSGASEFMAPDDGELVLLVNDVWYRNNKGVMTIEISRKSE